MPETPHERFEYPTKAHPAWFQKGAVIDADGREIEQEYDGIVDWLEQLEISVTGQVETLQDLPEPDPEVVNERTGDQRLYLVKDESVLYQDTGEEWEAIGLSELEIEDDGLTIGEVSRFNFSNQIDASLEGDGETVRIDAEIDDEDIAPDTVDVGVELNVPAYSETADAEDDYGSGSMVYITGSGADPAGLYYSTESGWDRLESGSSGATSLSELAININKDWQGYNITNAGDVSADSVAAASAMDIPVYDGSDPADGNIWIRSDR